MSWTFKDEMQLRDLEGRVQHLHRVRAAAVQRVGDVFTEALGVDLNAVNWPLVIARAEALRDALEPFDSGTRPAAVAEPTPIPTAGYPSEWVAHRPVCDHD